jgi:hypothetical protein
MVRSFASPFFLAATVVATPTSIADTDDSIAGFGKLDGFTFPRLGGDNADQTVFGGYVESGSALLVYDSTGAGRLDGFNSSTTDAAGNNFNGFGDFGVSSSNHPLGVPVVTFVSTAAGVDGVFLQMPSGTILRVASTDQVYPPAGDAFYMLSEPSVAVSEDKTECYVSFAARAGQSWRGILLAKVPADADGNEDVVLTTVADTSTPIPAGNISVNFRCLSVPQATPQGDVVFFGSNCGSTGSLFVEAQWARQAFSGWTPRDSDILTKNRGSFYGASNVNPGIWRYGKDDGSIIEVVNFETTIPGGQPGESFVAFSDPGVSLDGTAAFVGLGNNGSYGVFKGSRSKPLALVAGRQTPVPLYSDYTFQNIPNVPSLGPQGEVVFFGAATSDIAGIFAEDPENGVLSTVINYDVQVEGQPLLYVGFGTQAYSNGVAAAYMVLNDTTCGVWNLPVTHSKAVPTELV